MTKTTLAPLHDRVLIRRISADTKSRGGLFIPDSAKEKPARGVVEAVGKGKRDEAGNRIALDIEVGDEVLFGKYAGTELTVDGVEFIVLREDELLVRLRPVLDVVEGPALGAER